MNSVFLGIGGNLGNRIENLRKAVEMIKMQIGESAKTSSVYLSEPWGFAHSKYFANIVMRVETCLSADEVLEKAMSIEAELKRTRSGKGYEGRTMDIDILFFNDEVINTENLIVPHPRINSRLFVLMPMAEIAPNFIHSTENKTVTDLLHACPDKSKIRKLKIIL
ncbi:MAG: 2-amino-4-hydroxy-6-hydroxymethyldihydropteridine diphosphokinase [Bacteroidales bacterium]|nr:2-amino-4-hydroxy-6-hydroxymethyldihydropteridine diphosphokinase [Bacteroidales bacterium]